LRGSWGVDTIILPTTSGLSKDNDKDEKQGHFDCKTARLMTNLTN